MTPNTEPTVAGSSAPVGDLYEDLNVIHPRAVKGIFRNAKWVLMVLLLTIFHVGPFLRWDRGLGAPDQAILVDMAGRRAYFFFIEIWPQEVYYLTGLLLMAGITLFLMSALAGRLWCGFLCFQTVYTDLFVLIERLVIGDRGKRIAFDRRKWDLYKASRKLLIWSVWALIAAACGISFVLFFDDAFHLLPQIFNGEAGAGVYTFIAIVGGGCFIMAGFGREQVCIYVCPYSRFQAAMFDEHSLIIAYEAWRGEPRGAARKGQSFEGRGHCIDCKACVVSCPTGVDIRLGNQLACIGCGLCIDACNTMMDRYNLPRGLISYDSHANLEARGAGATARYRILRPRTLIYVVLLSLIAGVMVTALSQRSTIDVSILHERSPLWVSLSSGDIRNGYTYKVLNKDRQAKSFTLSVDGLAGGKINIIGDKPGAGDADIAVDGDDVGTYRVYVTAPASSITGKSTPFTFVLSGATGTNPVRSSAKFMGPEKD